MSLWLEIKDIDVNDDDGSTKIISPYHINMAKILSVLMLWFYEHNHDRL